MKNLLLVILLTIIFAQEYPPGKDIPVITKEKWVQDLIVLARDRNTEYNNEYPYNVLYYDGNVWSADCSNLHKSLFNKRDIYDYTPNECQWDLSNTGDITEYQLISRCTDQSNDFTRLRAGEPRLLYMDGHIGAYLGQVIDGQYNAVEAAYSFGKITFSWVDSDGTRRDRKGGSYCGNWLQHGKPSRWVIY